MFNITDFITAGATLLAAGVAWVAARDARKSATRQSYEAARRRQETAVQVKVAIERLQAEHNRALQVWADAVLDQMLEAYALFKFHGDALQDVDLYNKKTNIAWKLSALIERGRLFEPNTNTSEYKDSSGGYPGSRPSVLNPIKRTYELITQSRAKGESRELSPSEIAIEIFDKHRVKFVVEVQAIIDPRKTVATLQQLADERGKIPQVEGEEEAELAPHRGTKTIFLKELWKRASSMWNRSLKSS